MGGEVGGREESSSPGGEGRAAPNPNPTAQWGPRWAGALPVDKRAEPRRWL